MEKKTVTFKGIILVSPDDFKDIINGETTIGFKYDGIGCVFGAFLLFGSFLLNIILYAGKFMLLHCILCLVMSGIAFPVAIIKKDHETFFIRRMYAIIGPPVIALVWFTSGGIKNPLGFIWMVAAVSYNSFLVTGKKGKWYVSYAIAVNVLAVLITLIFPNTLLPIENEQNILWQSLVAAVFVCIYIGLTTWFQRKIAENLQDKLAESNKTLAKLNEEIKQNTQAQIELKLHEEKLIQEKKQAEETSLLLVQTLSSTIEARNEYLRGHSSRVSDYSALIAEKMGMSKENVERIRVAATLHDIGKISVPDAVLNKPSRLTDEEYNIIKNHCRIGADLLKNIDVISYTADIARHHHERYDGKGYPDGLKGEEISIGARIVAVADSFDAMNSKRVYRDPMDREKIRSEIVKNRGLQFDPEAADAFLELLDSGAIDALNAK